MMLCRIRVRGTHVGLFSISLVKTPFFAFSLFVYANSFYRAQKITDKHVWKDPEVLKDIVSNEIVVAGVYLRLFVSNPAWTLRKPKQFLADLLDFVVEQISKSSTEVNFLYIYRLWSLLELIKIF